MSLLAVAGGELWPKGEQENWLSHLVDFLIFHMKNFSW